MGHVGAMSTADRKKKPAPDEDPVPELEPAPDAPAPPVVPVAEPDGNTPVDRQQTQAELDAERA